MIKSTNLLIAAVITVVFCTQLSAQADAQTAELYIKNRWNIKAGYSSYKTGIYMATNTEGMKSLRRNDVRLEVNYGFLNYLEAGVYGGLFGLEKVASSDNMQVFLCPAYGINVNFHPLPLFMPEKSFKFDIYLTGKAGGKTFEKAVTSSTYAEYGLGAGASYYIFKHAGLYAEYSLGKYRPTEHDYNLTGSFRFGITVKF